MELTILLLVGVAIFAIYYAYHALAEKLTDLQNDVDHLIKHTPEDRL